MLVEGIVALGLSQIMCSEVSSYEIIEFRHKTVQEQVIEEIEYQALKHGVDVETALRIARCESNYDQYARNPYSSASGVYQFINSTFAAHCQGDVFDYKANILCFMELYPKYPSYWVCK